MPACGAVCGEGEGRDGMGAGGVIAFAGLLRLRSAPIFLLKKKKEGKKKKEIKMIFIRWLVSYSVLQVPVVYGHQSSGLGVRASELQCC